MRGAAHTAGQSRGQRANDDDGVEYLRDVDALLARGEHYIVICDATDALMPEPSFIRTQARWMQANIPKIQALNRGVALVLPSALTRGILRGLSHVAKLPVPYEVFETLEEARSWADSRARALAEAKAAPHRG
jgi:hypothetical protein